MVSYWWRWWWICSALSGAGAGGVRSSHGPGGPNPSPEAQVTLFAGTVCPITIGAGPSNGIDCDLWWIIDGQPGGHTTWTIPSNTIRAEGGGGAPSWDPSAGQPGGCGAGKNAYGPSAGWKRNC